MSTPLDLVSTANSLILNGAHKVKVNAHLEFPKGIKAAASSSLSKLGQKLAAVAATGAFGEG